MDKEHKQSILEFMIELRQANTKAIPLETVLKSLNLDNTSRCNQRRHDMTQGLAEESLSVDDGPDREDL